MVHQEQITFDTTGHRQMDDLTDKVAAIVERSGITTGIAQMCCVVAMVTAISALGFAEESSQPGAERVVKRFNETKEAFANPGQGWMVMQRLPYGEGRFPYSTPWLPGDVGVAGSLHVPATIRPGRYTLGLAFVDPTSEKAALRLAIDAPCADRLYRLTKISVE